MEESRKRSTERDYEEDLTVYFTGKRPRASSEMLTFDDEEEELMMMITSEEEEDLLLADGFPIQEEMVKQVMKVLEEELRSPNKKLFSTSSSSSSSSSTSYFTINNYNEESCGPSISDSSSSVMASMDIGSINIAYLLSFSEEFWSSLANKSLILPAAVSANVEQLVFPRNEQQFSVNEVVGDQNQKQKLNQKDQDEEDEEDEEESVDEWINRVLNGDLLEFDVDGYLV